MPKTHWLEYVKEAAVQAVEAGSPCDYVIGTVVSINPMKIKLSDGDGLELDADFIYLARNVTDFETEFTLGNINVCHPTQTDPPAAVWADRQKITIHNGLKKGDRVVMVRKSGGQDYIVIDRVVG